MPQEKFKKLCCWKCDLGMALIDSDMKCVTVKPKEFVFYVYGGMIKIICWTCGAVNLIIDDKFQDENKEAVLAEENNGHQRAVMKPWIGWDDWGAHQKKRPPFRGNNNGHWRPQPEVRKNV